MFFAYLVRCADGTLYGGYTTDLQKRLAAHNSGKGAKYTRSRLPVELVWWEECPTKEAAMSREWHIKHLTREQKLALIAWKEENPMVFRKMEEEDIQKVIPLYMDYYNGQEGGCWTEQTTYKRIHQVWSREDSHCLLLELKGQPVGFAMGYMEQYDDLVAYDLVEIVIAAEHQKKGLGTQLMLELERQVKAAGAAMIQLEAVNDEMHERFYGKMQYGNASNLVLKCKMLG